MSARDDFGSNAGRPGGYGGGAGGLGNGGIGGGMGGGMGGGGAGINGGIGSRTGLTTGTSFSGDQRGRPGGISEQLASAYAKARGARPGVSAPKRPVAQTPLPPFAPPPVVEPPLPPYVDEPVVQPTAFNPYDALRAYQSFSGPEMWSTAGTNGVRYTGNTLSNRNSKYGYGGGVTDAFGRTYR